MIVATISALFLSCGPTAIGFVVAGIVVDSVNGMQLTWASAHVFQKSRKRLAPTAANGKSTATVSFICRMGAVATSSLHGGPARVFGDTCLVISRVSMLYVSTARFAASAAAAGYVSAFKMVGVFNSLLATFAKASPARATKTVRASKGDNCKPAKRLASQVLKPWAFGDREFIRHNSLLFSGFCLQA